MAISKIYVDLDGTLVNFNQGVKELGWTDEEKAKYENDDPMWVLVANCPHFYANLKPLDGAIDFFNKLIERFGKDKVEILSGVPRNHRGVKTSREDKNTWCKKYLPPDIKVNLCLRAEKINFCKDKSCILIDDLKGNCKEWEVAGGIAILCRQNYDEMLNEILELK